MKFDHQKGRTIVAGDAKLYVEELCPSNVPADAPVMILLHGGFGDMESFNSITPALGQTFGLIAMDTRGHGASTLGTQPLTYELLANDLDHVIKTLGVKDYHLMGFSDGGITAYRYAAKKPQGLQKLITIGSGWELSTDDPEWGMYSEMTERAWKRMFPQTHQQYMALNPQANWEAFADSVLAMWKNLGPNNYPREMVKEIACETLVIRGDKDPITNLSSMAKLGALIENMNYFNIPFAEHVAFDDQPELFLNALAQFLKVEF